MKELFLLKLFVVIGFVPFGYFLFQTILSGIAAWIDCNPADARYHKIYREKMYKFGIAAVIVTEIVVRVLRVRFQDSALFNIHIGIFVIPLITGIVLEFTLARERKHPIVHKIVGALVPIWFIGVAITGGILLYRL